jgi:hypothetical protein
VTSSNCCSQVGVAHEAGVVDQHVEASERVDGLRDHAAGAREVADVAVACNGLTARGDDLVDNLLGRRRLQARAVEIDVEIVDDYLRALLGEQQRVLASKPVSGAGDERDASFQ